MLDIKKMYSHIKSIGYSHSKDDLGTYFDMDGQKLSIIKTGLWYTCYHNTRIDGNWHLTAKSQVFDKFEQALGWIVKEIEKSH
ncbi:MAG: hypothetical protein K0R18_194 [Bacillales bacterium]|jgi:hypothetical protein|nr:hypothetical protein [Bacillales bacterium]